MRVSEIIRSILDVIDNAEAATALEFTEITNGQY